LCVLGKRSCSRGTRGTISVSSDVSSTRGLPEPCLYDDERSLRHSEPCKGVVGLAERPLLRWYGLLDLCFDAVTGGIVAACVISAGIVGTGTSGGGGGHWLTDGSSISSVPCILPQYSRSPSWSLRSRRK
jgi:hypothetical protein